MNKNRMNWATEKETIIKLFVEKRSLKAVAEHYGVTPERIRQVCIKQKIDLENVRIQLRVYNKRGSKGVSNPGDRTMEHYQLKKRKYYAKKSNARKNGILFSIKFEEIVFPTHCPILGIPINYGAVVTEEGSCSFDQLDPYMGYTKENTRVISWRANRIKNDGTWQEHMKIGVYVRKELNS